MYKIQMRNEGVDDSSSYVTIYDQNSRNDHLAFGAKGSFELNEAGSINFTLLPGHPYIDDIWPLSTYIRVLDDDEEIFYGRVLDRGDPTLTGQVTIQCEGALAFLCDSEIPPDAKDRRGNPATRTLTAEAFFRDCISKHNAEVDDTRRQFSVGTVSASKKSKTSEYSITSFTQTKSALESFITGTYGGYLRVRPKDGGGHYIDWIEEYETVNPQTIQIGNNLVDQTNQFDSANLFTVIRPIGKDGSNDILLDEETIDLYPEEAMESYGRIVKTIEFKDADTKEKLSQEAYDYVDRMKATLFIGSNIKLVDMHYLDGTKPKIRLGDRFTHIVGLDGVEMTVASLELDFEQVQNDSLGLKNEKSLIPDLTPEGRANKSKGRSLSKSSKKATSQALKYYKEFEDKAMIQVNTLEIDVKDLGIHVENQFIETAAEFERISGEITRVEENVGRVLDGIRQDVETINGTAVIQNSETIAEVAGNIEVWTDENGHKTVHVKTGTAFAIDDLNGATMLVGEEIGETREILDGHWALLETITGSALWTQQDAITGVVGEFDVRTEYETVPDPDHPGQTIQRPKQTLIVKSGGGLKIERNGVEYGVYDNGSLSGGIIVDKINDNKTVTKILGSKVDIRAEDIAKLGVYTGDTLTGGIIAEKLNDGTVVTKIRGDVISLTANQLAEFGVWTDDSHSNLAGAFVEILEDNSTEFYINTDHINFGDGEAVAASLYGCDIGVQNLTAYHSLNLGGDEYSFTPSLVIKAGSTIKYDGQQNADIGGIIRDAYISGQNLYFNHLNGESTKFELINGNTLRITDRNGATLDFSKAVSLSAGSWNGNKWTVSATQNGSSVGSRSVMVDTRFGLNPDGNYLEIFEINQTNGNTTSVTATRRYVKLGRVGSEVQIQDTSGTQLVNSPVLRLPLQTMTVNQNNTYTPASGYYGIGSIKVQVPDATAYDVRFGSSSGSYFVGMYTKESGDLLNGSTLEYKLGRSGSTVQIQNSSGTKLPNTPTLTLPLQTKTVSTNDTYTPDSGYYGIGSIKVQVPDVSAYKTNFGSASGSYFIGIYDKTSNNLVSGSSVTYKLGKNTAGTQVQIQNSSGTKLANTPTISIGTPVTNVVRAGLDSAFNRNGSYWNCLLYNSSGTNIRTLSGSTPNQTGLYFPVKHLNATENNHTYNPKDENVAAYTSVYVNVSTSGGSISIPDGNVSTTSSLASGTSWNNAEALKKAFLRAQSDYDYVIFKVTCGSVTKWYYMDPHG